jgi:hypothetical protein
MSKVITAKNMKHHRKSLQFQLLRDGDQEDQGSRPAEAKS